MSRYLAFSSLMLVLGSLADVAWGQASGGPTTPSQPTVTTPGTSGSSGPPPGGPKLPSQPQLTTPGATTTPGTSSTTPTGPLPPGALPAGGLPPGALPPGALPPGALPPGADPPGTVAPNAPVPADTSNPAGAVPYGVRAVPYGVRANAGVAKSINFNTDVGGQAYWQSYWNWYDTVYQPHVRGDFSASAALGDGTSPPIARRLRPLAESLAQRGVIALPNRGRAARVYQGFLPPEYRNEYGSSAPDAIGGARTWGRAMRAEPHGVDWR